MKGGREIPGNISSIPGARFVLVAAGGKNPIQKGWQEGANHTSDSEQIAVHLNGGGNVGILGGSGNEKKVLVIDFDSKDTQDRAVKYLPKTLTYVSGSRDPKKAGLFHLVYLTNEPLSRNISGESGADGMQMELVDIIGRGKQALIPPSVHPDGDSYNIINDMAPVYATYTEIKNAIMHSLPQNAIPSDWLVDGGIAAEHNKHAQKLKIENMFDTSKFIHSGTRLQGAHPVHGSVTGMNLVIDTKEQIWYCFRHQTGGNALHFYAVLQGELKCENIHRRPDGKRIIGRDIYSKLKAKLKESGTSIDSGGGHGGGNEATELWELIKDYYYFSDEFGAAFVAL